MGRLIPIDDAADPRLAVFRLNERGLASRADRRDDHGAGRFLAEGDLVVERALDAGCRPVAALADGTRIPAVAERLMAIAAGLDVYVGGPAIRRLVTGLGMPHAVVAVFERPARPSADELIARCRTLVIVEAVDNPANIGAIVRNAAALGWDGLLLDHTSADPLSRRSLRVAMGTVFTLPHARTDRLADVVAGLTGWTVIALTPDRDATDLDLLQLDDPHRAAPRALLVGAERSGLGAEMLAVASHRVRIPMAGGVDSLNVAAATAIACHVLRR